MPTHGAQQSAQQTACKYDGVLPTGGETINPCGTPAAARRHHRRGEPLDDACREAFRRYHRDYRRRARQLAIWRERENDHARRYQQRLRADPAARASLNARRREKERQRREQIRRDSQVDEVAVERRIKGDATVTLNRAEKRAAFHALRSAGHSVTAAGTQLGLSGFTAKTYEHEFAATG